MFQVDNSVNLMLNIQNLIYRKSSVNVLLSPFSLEILSFSIISGITGQCYEELSNILFGKDVQFEDIVEAIRCFKLIIHHIKSMDNAEIRINNFVYLSKKYDLLESYSQFVNMFLDTKVQLVDFGDGTNELNKTIEQDFSGRINQLVKLMPTLSKLLLVNSTTFQGELKSKPTKTYEGKFRSGGGTEEGNARFSVYKSCFKYNDKSKEFIYVEMPYKNETMNLCLVFPKQGITVGDVLSKLNYTNLSQLFRSSEQASLEIHIPAVKLQSNIDLAPVLHSAGIIKVFEEENANFSKLSNSSNGLYLESVVTNTEVNLHDLSKFTNNTTTGSRQSSKATSQTNPTATVSPIVLNRPFIFFINCDTKKLETIILFSGVVNSCA